MNSWGVQSAENKGSSKAASF
ncbi:hypothetical protein B14911_01580 [Bacillus sp. NRRL B-14911]|nr:hypothetical protein B14911_01580 [Bacillus sp. NRRL B-14911]